MKPDWEKIKTDYITGKMSQRELAEKYEVPLSNLKRRAVKEDWVKRRTQHETKVVTKVEEKRAGRKADKNRKIYNGMMKTYFYQYMGPKPPRRPRELAE